MRNSELLHARLFLATIDPSMAELTDYLAQLMPNMTAGCEGTNCSKLAPVAQMVTEEGKRYCSQKCADFHNAPMIKPQPKTTRIDGWNV